MLGALPEALQRSLYSAFQLQVRYHRPRHEVTIRVTIRADALPTLTQIVKEAAGTTDTQVNAAKPAAIGSHVLGRPRQDSNLRTRLRRPHPRAALTCMDPLSEKPVGAWGATPECIQVRNRTSLIYTSDYDNRFNAGAALRGQGPAI